MLRHVACVAQAMITVHARLLDDPALRSVWLVLQLHDELVLELPTRLRSHVAALVVDAMEHRALPGSPVRLVVTAQVGPTLGDMNTNINIDELDFNTLSAASSSAQGTGAPADSSAGSGAALTPAAQSPAAAAAVTPKASPVISRVQASGSAPSITNTPPIVAASPRPKRFPA